MKIKITICAILISLIAAAMFFSCDNPLALGTKLDISGPVVSITSPSMRQSVPSLFYLEGTIKDSSPIDRMIVTAVVGAKDFPRQWRYQNGAWEVSDDYGASWSPFEDALWEGTSGSVTWKITVNMSIPGRTVDEGEYTFNVQAWDKADFSDDNSFKSVVLIVDLNPPKVDISYPLLYRGLNAYEISPLKPLHEIGDNGDEKEKPEYLGKFLTQEFELKWQIDDINDVWSIDLRFYKYDAVIDNNPETSLPSDYIYKFFQNMPPVPPNVKPSDYIRPNGSVIVPDLTNPAGFYDQGGEIKNPVTEKITIKAVAVCYDAAGNPNQEKTLGYFIYWPKANKPWITFSEGMNKAEDAYGKNISLIEGGVFTVFPSKYIKATAYQAHGVKKVEYKVYECKVEGVTDSFKGTLSNTLTYYSGQTLENQPYSPGVYSTIFPWQFDVPHLTGYYVVKAKAFSNKDKESEEYEMLFRVNDITFPDFPTPVQPAASVPLFNAISATNTITISGTVSDATQIESLCMVWINPESENYASMTQLAYFLEKDYEGWKAALKLTAGGTAIANESGYDLSHPNRLWRLSVTPASPPIDPETNRRVYTFSRTIPLSDLNIGMNTKPTQPYNPLRSQVFLLRAENPAKQCTIITYAPQGDTVQPVIQITNVRVGTAEPFVPNVSAIIPKFTGGETITIEGTWTEDSLSNSNLNINMYFTNNFVISVNNTLMPLPLVNRTSTTATTGTWTLTTRAAVSATTTNPGEVPLGALKDNLVIDAKTRDIGGNEATLTNSWLIQSDHLTLTRVSSEADDDTYANGKTIEIFLEFSKPVKLTNPNPTNKPQLILNSVSGRTARAIYKDGQTDPNSRQYFVYNVATGHNTGDGDYLNVKGLYYGPNTTADTGTEYTSGTAYTTSDYPFSWSRGAGDQYEEVRLTMQPSKTGETKEGPLATQNYYPRTLPTSNTDQSTLFASKHIKIDTTAPTVVSVTSNTPAGWYSGGDIYFTVNFSEPVKLGSTTPQFPLVIGGGRPSTSAAAGDVTVSGSSITFKYAIQSGDSSGETTAVYVSSSTAILGNSITDIAGNALANSPLGNLGQTARTLTGVYVETMPPGTPTVRILSAANVANVVSNSVSGTPVTGISSVGVPKNLYNLYNENLWLAIEGTGDSYKYDAIEYTTDGTNWIRANNTNTPIPISQAGNYNIRARQIDKAGNVTASDNYSGAITFNWDPGSLVSRVSSTNANGTYTHTAGRNQIQITVYFRKPLYFSVAGNASIEIDVKRGGSNITLNTPVAIGTAYSSLVFTYTVANGDTTNGAILNIVSPAVTFNVTPWDSNTDASRVNVMSLLNLPTAAPNKFDKELTVETGSLTIVSTPSFAADSGTEGNDNFHGIRTDDGSYWTTLNIPFNRAIFKGSGNITITQIAGTGTSSYRLPAVMTESQYNRFKNVANIDTYYVKGTNGYINGTDSDTSNKYVLKYEYNPDSNFTGTGFIPAAFFTAFRNAEAISVNVNAQAVTIDGSTLKVRLTGSSAPQVPGATYQIILPAELVTDSLGNKSELRIFDDVTLRGVAKPFIRIKKPQETITTQTASGTAPRFTVSTQPMQATARMDCRTPGSNIYYTTTNTSTSVNNNNFNTATVPNPAAAPGQPSQPTNASTQYTAPVTIGDNPAVTAVQGYKWRVMARALVGSTYSAPSEEIAYRTVITYQLRNGTGAITAAGGESILANGDQIWLRGGDAIGSSSIPGFPFTWEDNWNNLSEKRAGIRLMTKTNTTDSLNNSVWKYVTWDLSATAYVDFIRGRDTGETVSGVTYSESTLPVIWQYGPKRWAYQRAGWTSFKTSYSIFPGEHRWCDAGDQHEGKGAINFSGTFYARPDKISDYTNPNQQ